MDKKRQNFTEYSLLTSLLKDIIISGGYTNKLSSLITSASNDESRSNSAQLRKTSAAAMHSELKNKLKDNTVSWKYFIRVLTTILRVKQFSITITIVKEKNTYTSIVGDDEVSQSFTVEVQTR